MPFFRSLQHTSAGLRSLVRVRVTQRTVSSSAREFKAILDNGTLYVPQPVAEALGWTADEGQRAKSVQLTLSGWEPHYFAIARAGTDSDLLARETVESSQSADVRKVLELLKEYDSK